MSVLSRRSAVAGYMLFEALVAVAVAGLVLAAFVQTQAVARKAARLPAEIVGPSGAAEALLSDWLEDPAKVSATGVRSGYAYRAEVLTLELRQLPSRLAPPLIAAAPDQPPAAAAPAPRLEVRGVELHVRAPDGRQLDRESAGVFASP